MFIKVLLIRQCKNTYKEVAFSVLSSACPPQTKLSFLDCKMVRLLLQLVGLWAESDQTSPTGCKLCLVRVKMVVMLKVHGFSY